MKDYLAERAELIASATPGVEAARHLSGLTDEAVRDLARAASGNLEDRWALVALGGWGAGALQPHSDLDILVLSEAPPGRLKPFVEALLYPLWDAGFKVGHQVRSPKQQLQAMREDLKTCTAALTARPLAGDVDWALSALVGWLKHARKRSSKTAALLVSRERPGSPFLLEPDLKEGAGGRRDFDELVWHAALSSGETARDPEALVTAQLMTPEELERVRAAAGAIAACRWELQRATGSDRLTLDAAYDLVGVDLERVQAALGDTSLVLNRVRRRIAGHGDAPASDLSSEELLGLLDVGAEALPALEEAAQSGRMEAVVPGMKALMSCRRPGLGHELTVGAHSLRTAATLFDIDSRDGALARSLQTLPDRRLVQVAALVHDLGKQERGEGHAERGAVTATDTAHRFGLDERSAQDVSDLVRLHLVLVDTALRQDLDNEDVILRGAALVGRRELLGPLHLLTAADSRATGPATWSAWTAALVGRLVSRLDGALSPDVDGAGLAARGESIRSTCLGLLNADAAGARTFVELAPLRYLASRGEAEVVRDAELVAHLAQAPAATTALLGVSPGLADGTYVVTVASIDRPQLLARLSGAVALAGLDILSVDAHGVTGGIALDSFVVTSATERPVTTETFAALERLVDAALRDRLELAVRLRERARHYPPKVAGEIAVSVEAAGWMTALHVSAPDRPGLLHDIAHAVAASDAQIGWAKVQTIDGIARDVFSLVGPDGAPLDDPGVLGHVTMNVRAAL